MVYSEPRLCKPHATGDQAVLGWAALIDGDISDIFFSVFGVQTGNGLIWG